MKDVRDSYSSTVESTLAAEGEAAMGVCLYRGAIGYQVSQAGNSTLKDAKSKILKDQQYIMHVPVRLIAPYK